MANQKTRIAICYDFDGTLAPGNMQEYSFLPAISMSKEKFWTKVNTFAKENDMDEILSYMHIMIEEARKKRTKIDRASFVNMGKKIKLFPGVDNWFPRINSFAEKNNVTLEHYIISSGLKEIIEGTLISKEFKHIFASKFLYEEYNKPIGPAVAINYTTKTQFLFRINKGIFNFYDNVKINESTPLSKRYIPFSHIIYIGDGYTDIPCMKLVRMQNGYSIAVYNPHKKHQRSENSQLIIDGRADFLLPANYEKNSEIEETIKTIINKIVLEDILKKNKDLITKYLIEKDQVANLPTIANKKNNNKKVLNQKVIERKSLIRSLFDAII